MKLNMRGRVVVLAVLVCLAVLYCARPSTVVDPHVINDVSKLNPTTVKEVVYGHEVEGIQQVLAQARQEHLVVSIAGKRHSMGGHTFYPGGVVLDMTSFNKVLSVDAKNKLIRVQSGATWEQVIEAADKYNLSVEIMQAYNTFTVGGSMSVNVHESDPNFGSMIDSVKSFTLLLPNDTIVNVSRTENADLFNLVIGGYGMFGVILDAELFLTDNEIYAKQEQVINYKDYLQTFRALHADPSVKNIFARLSIARDDTLLRDMVVTTYNVTQVEDDELYTLWPQEGSWLKKFVFDLSRDYRFGKKLRWYLQKEHSDLTDPPLISRNNLMNGNLTFLDYTPTDRTDILQEYFVPVENLPAFIDDLRTVVEDNDLNLLSATIRYIPQNDNPMLTYATHESYGVVLYFNIGTSAEEQAVVKRWTQQLIEHSLAQNGTFYLPYELYATREQVRRAYPHFDAWVAQKQRYDPDGLFNSKFYSTYAQ